MAKNMFENFDFEEYAELLEQAKVDNVHVVHTFDKNNHKGGFTIAWIRDEDYKGKVANNKMVLVAVSYCSEHDYFSRKIGSVNALRNLYSGNFVSLPIASEDSENVVETLRYTFDFGGYCLGY